MNVRINGKSHEVPDGATVVDALRAIGLSEQAKGVAVAVDDQVVPRSRWTERPLDEAARVEIVTAAQGG